MQLYQRLKHRRTEMFLGQTVTVAFDPPWVSRALNEMWYSISKSKGVWQVYCPYLMVWDTLDSGSASKLDAWRAAVETICTQMGFKFRMCADPRQLDYVCFHKVKFSGRRAAKEFIFLMAIEGFTYIPSKQIQSGPVNDV